MDALSAEPPELAFFGNPPGFLRAAGLHLTEVSPTRVEGWIDLSSEQHTPFGIVHGGVYTTAIETAASVGATAAAAERGQVAVGVTNITNFLRPRSDGRVTVTAVPIQQGRVQQLWQVDIADAEGKLVATGQLRVQNIDRPPPR